MKFVIRYFFRVVRLILTPIVLLNEKLTTPQGITRTPEEQARVDAVCDELALYQFQACPFCIRVRKEISRLGLNIEKRDAQKIPEHRQALEQGGGRIKVPCLRIAGTNGEDQWLYESDEINTWLNQRFA